MTQEDNIDVGKRAEEVKAFVVDNNMNRATVRLIDFAREFRNGKTYYNETLLVRKSFTKLQPEIRIYGYSNELRQRETELSHQVLQLTDEISERYVDHNPPPRSEEPVPPQALKAEHPSQPEKQVRLTEDKPAPDLPEEEDKSASSLGESGFIRAEQKPDVSSSNNLSFPDEKGEKKAKPAEQDESIEPSLPLSIGTEEGPTKQTDSQDEPERKEPSRRPIEATVDIDSHSKVGIVASPKTDIICQASGVHKSYRRNKNFSLNDVSMTLRAGEVTGLVGENGNGKTTLINIIAGELAASKGEITFPFLNSKSHDWLQSKKEIGYMPQRLPSWGGYLKDNLHFSAALNGIHGKKNEEEVEYVVYRLGLEKYLNLKWNEISGGYQTRFALAGVLIWNPKLLILDEPLSNLDINAQIDFLQDLRDLANSKTNPIAVLITSQHLHEIESVANKIMFLEDGDVKFYGTLRDLGKDRDRNFFEVSGTITGKKLRRDTLFDILFELDVLDIEDTGLALIIHTPTSVQANEVVQRILSRPDITLEYFRDISRSTKTLFRKRY